MYIMTSRLHNSPFLSTTWVGDALSDTTSAGSTARSTGPTPPQPHSPLSADSPTVACGVLLPSHGPIPADTAAAFAMAQRLVDDPAGLVWARHSADLRVRPDDPRRNRRRRGRTLPARPRVADRRRTPSRHVP